jgi:hypothetical protein
VSGGVLRYAEAERLHAELVRPVRLITQHVLELLLRLLTGERVQIGPNSRCTTLQSQPCGRAGP